MTPFDKRNMREINDFFPICRPGSSAACLDRRRGSSRRPHESKSLRHLLRHDIILFDPCEKLNCSEFSFAYSTAARHASFAYPVSDIPERYGIRVPACHPGYFHRQKTKASLPHPRPHHPAGSGIPQHRRGFRSFFLDRPESKLKHFVVALRVSGDLLRRIQTVIDMIFHDLLIVRSAISRRMSRSVSQIVQGSPRWRLAIRSRNSSSASSTSVINVSAHHSYFPSRLLSIINNGSPCSFRRLESLVFI